MKIFILDKFKITKFNLPEKIEDSFLIPYKGHNNKNDNFVTVEANEDNWQLKSNGTVNILDGTNIVDNIILENYNYYTLKILGQEDFATLFALPSRDEETYKLDTKNLTSITIGSSPNCKISYRNNLTAEIHAEIKFVNNDWYIAGSADDSYRTYINGERILTAKLNVGDVIFINGLKIIWMKSFIKINNPKQCVGIAGINVFEELEVNDNTKYTPVSDEEANDLIKYKFDENGTLIAIEDEDNEEEIPPIGPGLPGYVAPQAQVATPVVPEQPAPTIVNGFQFDAQGNVISAPQVPEQPAQPTTSVQPLTNIQFDENGTVVSA